MRRQHSVPIWIGPAGAEPLVPLGRGAGDDAVSERFIQHLVHDHPETLPIAEIDPLFVGPVPICQELRTPSGSIDNLMITPSGLPILIECKLWRNPESLRKVVGQILDYAKDLSAWNCADVQRELNKGRASGKISLIDLVRRSAPELDEIHFNDALTENLKRGRFLLLIVGDGIRQRVEAIAEYLQKHSGLHFSLGLVEFPIYRLPSGGMIVAPRVLVRTEVIRREVFLLPDGVAFKDSEDSESSDGANAERLALGDQQQAFWSDFLAGLDIDDREQPIPNAARSGYLSFSLPAPAGSCWLTVYRDMRKSEVGVMLSSHRNSAGERAMFTVADDWSEVKAELGGTARVEIDRFDRPKIADSFVVSSLDDPGERSKAFSWLAERVNTFVNVLRPRIRSAVSGMARHED